MDIVPGYKTLIAVLVLAGLGAYLIVNEKPVEGGALLATALAFFGVSKKIDREPPPDDSTTRGMGGTGAAVVALSLLVGGCAQCPAGVEENARNVTLIADEQERLLPLLPAGTLSEKEKDDVLMHLDRARTLANSIREACR